MIGLDEQLVKEKLREYSEEELNAAEKMALAAWAGDEFSVEGFRAFFKVCYGFDVYPDMEDALEELFKSTRIVIEAFIESAKTTTITEAFFAYFIGHHPISTNMLIQVSDSKAQETADAVARLMTESDDWKMIFPYVVPAPKPWGKDTGYQVRATRINLGVLNKIEARETINRLTGKTPTDEEIEQGGWRDVSDSEWHRLTIRRRDPTFVGYGYRNSAIQGKRIDGLLVIDDIHDDNNSFSALELQGTLRRLRSTIMTRAKKDAWRIFIGTPWVEGDTLDYAKGLKKYTNIFIPVYVPASEETPGAIYWPEIGEWVKTARDEYDADYLDERLDELKQADFARMLLLDLTKTGDRVFYFQEFDHEQISPNWPTQGGVDFANIMRTSQKNDPTRSFFSMAYVAKLPHGGAVVTGGLRARCTPFEAEEYMIRAQNTHPHWLGNIVEQDGKGEIFIFYLQQRHPELLFIPMLTHGKGKEKRLEMGMSPWFANGMVKISTANDPFLNALRQEMHDYPHARHVDCLDAVYWALRGMPDVLTMARKDRLPSTRRKKKKEYPFDNWGRRQ